MKTDRPDVPWIAANFLENQRKLAPDALRRYAGQYIAWSWDGTSILASDPDRKMLDQKLRTAGIDPAGVVHDYVDAVDVDCQL